MMAKKEEELTRWLSDQVHRNVSFNFRQQVITYCQSDMALLKAGCKAFQQEFQSQAGFKPMEKFMTIANACNLYWRKHHLPPNTIAVEPVRGLRGPMSAIPSRPCNGSITRNTKFPSRGPVRTGSNKSSMVGNSLCERLSRRWVRCPHTHCLRVPRLSLPLMPTWNPIRHVKHYATPDRTVEELYQATLNKRMALLRAGYKVIEMWECQWDRLVEN